MSPVLICFHHAGGTPAVFSRWSEALGLPVHAVSLPGRERAGISADDGAPADMDGLVAQLEVQLADVLEGPHVLCGYSMGALVAYSLLRRRRTAGGRLPDAMIVVASAAPHLPMIDLDLDTMSDLEIATSLSGIGGVPRELLARPEWLGPLMAPVKHDLRLCRTFSPEPRIPVPVPLHVIGGLHDPLVSRAKLEAWAAVAGNEFSLTVLDGGHFLVTENPDQVTDALGAAVFTTEAAR